MTTEEKAVKQAELHFKMLCNYTSPEELIKRAYRAGYLAGATEALASQWKDPKVELPEEKKPVLCFMADMKDPYAENDSYFDMAILLEGEFINLDAEIVHPSYWMPIPIPPLKGGDA